MSTRPVEEVVEWPLKLRHRLIDIGFQTEAQVRAIPADYLAQLPGIGRRYVSAIHGPAEPWRSHKKRPLPPRMVENGYKGRASDNAAARERYERKKQEREAA